MATYYFTLYLDGAIYSTGNTTSEVMALLAIAGSAGHLEAQLDVTR